MVSVILRAPLLAVFCSVFFPIADWCLRTDDNISTNNDGQHCASYGMYFAGSLSPPSWILSVLLTASSAIFNALTILDIGLAPRTKPWRCVLSTCYRIAQTNFKLGTIWLPWLLVSTINPARADEVLDELMETITGKCLKTFCRVMLDRPLLTGASFLAYVVLVSYCLRLLVPSQSSRRTRSIRSFFLDYLLNPETISYWNELELAPDSQLELLSRLAMPNLWLTPAVPTDYLNYLPTWQFSPQLVNSDTNGLLEDSKIASQRKTSKICYDRPAAAVFREATPHGFRGSMATGSQESAMCQGLVGSADCAICLEKYELNVVLCALPCGHYFHKNCIMAWLERDNHHCPICRWAAYRFK